MAVLKSWEGPGEPRLPDDAAGPIRWASGAQDGVRSHHMASMEEAREAELVYRVVELLKAAAEECSRGKEEVRQAELYECCIEHPVLSLIDPLMEELRRRRADSWDGLRTVALFLVHRSSHREPLKLGLGLLGMLGKPSDLEALKLVARHDEFTLFAAVAAARISDDPIGLWWDMARQVQGWGRIHLVERLVDMVEEKPGLREWLLEEGWDNSIMVQYLAYAIATRCGLVEALERPEPSDRVLDAACELMAAMLDPGPAEGIDDYEEGARAMELLLGHLSRRCNLSRALSMLAVEDWFATAEHSPEDWLGRQSRGWTLDLRRQLERTCRVVLDRPEWAEQVRQAYASGDEAARHQAWTLAPRVGVDLWEEGFQRLQSGPVEPFLCWALLERGGQERRARVLDWAQTALPLASIASGPEDRLGGKPEYTCLEFCIQFMDPADYREDLVATGLRCPSIRCRGLSMGVLDRVPRERWGDRAAAALRLTVEDEVVESLALRASKLAAS